MNKNKNLAEAFNPLMDFKGKTKSSSGDEEML